jgi:hypothetical protein
LRNYTYTFKGNYRLPVNAGDPINHAQEHSVENFDNLMVVYWLQDVVTKEVYQSGKADCVPDTFLVSVMANDPLGGNVWGGGDYRNNTEVTLAASANYGYTFANWTSNGTELSTNDVFTFTVTMDTVIMANFIPDTFSIAASPNDPLFGSVWGGGDYPYNAQATLTAIPNQGYQFVQWTSNGMTISNQNPFVFTVTTDIVLVAEFALDTFTVFVSVNDPFGGSVSGGGDYTYNTPITLTAIANPGYEFVNWTSNGIVISTDNIFNFTVTGDSLIWANFKEEGKLIVLVTANNPLYGSITGDGNYLDSAQVTLTANANPGYVFMNWTSNGNVISADNPFSFTITGDTIFVAHFAIAVTVSVSANNVYGLVEGGGTYPQNAQATVTAIANQDYVFVNWTSNGLVISTDNPFVFTVTEDTAFVANFATAFTVTVSVNDTLYGSVSGDGDYPYNAPVILTATANDGYAFENWTSGGVIISNANPFVFIVTGDTAIVANFATNVSITEADNTNNTIVLYPNPAQDRLTISGLSGSEDILLTDISGRTLYTYTVNGEAEIQIPVSNLARGMYFVRISTTTKVKTMKIVKE